MVGRNTRPTGDSPIDDDAVCRTSWQTLAGPAIRRQRAEYVRQSAVSDPAPMRTEVAVHSNDSLCLQSAR
jgi:hypothetical protein